MSQVSIGQQIEITDSLWTEALLYRLQQVESDMLNRAKEGTLQTYRSPRSDLPLTPAEIDQLGIIHMQFAGGAANGADTLIHIPFTDSAFVGIGFNRQMTHDLINANTTIQLDYISLLYKVEQGNLIFNQSKLFYVSMHDLVRELKQEDIDFIRSLDLWAKRLPGFRIQGLGTPKSIAHLTQSEITEQKVIIKNSEFKFDFEENLYPQISTYFSNNLVVYRTPKLTNAVKDCSKLVTLEAKILEDSIGSKAGAVLVYQFPLKKSTCKASILRGKNNVLLVKVESRSHGANMNIRFNDKSQVFYIPLSSLYASLKGINRVQMQTIIQYVESTLTGLN
ncbi:MAG: hypothetical protein ACI9JN_000715 [Bacteroidia bacterium]